MQMVGKIILRAYGKRIENKPAQNKIRVSKNDSSAAERRLRLKRREENAEINAAESIKSTALKQSVPLAAESMQMPKTSPVAADTAGVENIENAHKSGKRIMGVAVFMLMLITSE